MKIYFACSIRGGRDEADTYAKLAQHIKTQAHLLTELFSDGSLTASGMDKPSPEIWHTDMAWLQAADAMIAEVTNPSLGVGYEIAKAEEWNKPVLALYRDDPMRKLSAMIDGSPFVTIVYYRVMDEAIHAINQFIKDLMPAKK